MKFKLQVQLVFNNEWWDIWESETADTVEKMLIEISNNELYDDIKTAYAMRIIDINN